MVLESQAEARSGRDEVGHIKDFLSLSNWKAFENFFYFIYFSRKELLQSDLHFNMVTLTT